MSLAERVGGRVCFVFNPAAGRGASPRQAAGVAAVARRLGWEAVVRTTTTPGEEVVLARQAQDEGWPFVVAIGGDGTAHGVANGLLADGRAHALFGVVPSGSGNDFAYFVGLPPGPIAANVMRLLGGRTRRHDVGRVNNEYFVNGMGVGFDAEVVRQLTRFKRLAGFLRYLAAVYRTFWGFHPPRLSVVAGDVALDEPLTMLEVAIGCRAGGGFRLTPDARPDDRLLDVCVIRQVSVLEFLRYVPRVIRGTHRGLRPVTLLQCSTVRVMARHPPITAHLDGELREWAQSELVVELMPAALEVVCAP